MTTVHRIYQERAYLNRGKHRRLDEAFRECARLYNAALEEWRTGTCKNVTWSACAGLQLT